MAAKGVFKNGYYVVGNTFYGKGTAEYKQAQLLKDNMGGGKFKNGYYVVGNRFYGKGTSAYKNAMARAKKKKAAKRKGIDGYYVNGGRTFIGSHINVKGRLVRPADPIKGGPSEPAKPTIFKNRFGGYMYEPGFQPTGAGSAENVYRRNEGTPDGMVQKEESLSKGLLDPFGRTSSSEGNSPMAPKGSTLNSQDTYTMGNKVYHAQTGTFINDLEAEAEFGKLKKEPKMIKKFTGTKFRNGKKVRTFKMIKNPNFVDPGLNRQPGRAGMEADSGGKDVWVRINGKLVKRKMGNSSLNTLRNLRDGSNFEMGNTNQAFKTGGIQQDTGGPMEGAFQRQQNFNLSNNENLAQGSEHQWAQPTSISSLINGQLRQSANAGADYWDVWSQNKGGTTTLRGRPTPFGYDPSYSPSPQAGGNIGLNLGSDGVVRYAQDNPMGAFGTNTVMGEADEDPASTSAGSTLPGQLDPAKNNNPAQTGGSASNVYNPWSTGQGGEFNSFGPNPQHLAQATMESMALANAYFAPQRLELATQLGDMETDMRRLAVNLGRQVDDPVLQAKMYKEAMTATRTLDVQQNTFAFQMAEQRRREEMSNFQFYDQMAQQEYQLRLQNAHFYDELEVAKSRFNLDRWQVENHPMFNQGSGTAPAPTAGAPVTTAGAPTAPQADTEGGNLLRLQGRLY